MKSCFRKGEALLIVLALTGAVLIVMGGVFAYISFSARYAAAAVGRDVCRLAAQSEIELAKSAVFYRFMLSLNRSARIVGGATIGSQSASSFDWFEAYSSKTAKKTIGTKNTVTFANSVTNNGCIVKVRIGRVEHEVGTQWADVTFVAQATRRNPGGTTSAVTLAEKVRFAQQRSAVFNNAYFVNNYGWFKGSGCTANGDVRANGDMYLDKDCKINGQVYAAKNEELNVNGVINSTGKMDDFSTYKTATYGTSNRSRPLYNDPQTGGVNAGGYDAPEATVTTTSGGSGGWWGWGSGGGSTTTSSVSDQVLKDRIHPNQALSVEMPYIGDISSQDSDYRAWAQELHDADSSMSTIKKNGQTLVSVFYDGPGPSGLTTVQDLSGNTVTAPDYGAIVLEGTDSSPLEINGPVIIPSDVIIKGTVKGQGTIYSGRNIYIVGDITYKNPPSWSNKSTQNSNNASKDMLGLMAKGNIVLGNYKDSTSSTSSSSWESSFKSYLDINSQGKEQYVQKYKCDTSDAAIGYPTTFGGNYLAVETVSNSQYDSCKAAGLADYTPGGYDRTTGHFGKLVEVDVGTGQYTGSGSRRKEITEKQLRAQYGRKYYESVCNDSEISSRAGTKLTRIDAVLYNNHGVFGSIGKCSINGSLVCRNEAILYSNNLYLNWDIRLYSGSNETVSNDKVGLAKSSDASPQTLWWMEVPQSLVQFD